MKEDYFTNTPEDAGRYEEMRAETDAAADRPTLAELKAGSEMAEWVDTPSICLWPKDDHNEGDPLPEDFYARVTEGLKSVGIEWESTS